MSTKTRGLWDRVWKDNRGHVVIWQAPNVWLWGWIGFTTSSLLLSGKLADWLSRFGSVSLIIWSLLEVTRGVNYFRRALGLLVLWFSVMSLIRNL